MKNLIFCICFLSLLNSCDRKKSAKNKLDQPNSHTEKPQEKNNGENSEFSNNDNNKVILLETKSGKSFQVSENFISASISNVSIQPKGFAEVNETIILEEIDPVSDIFKVDLDQNNYDELYIITKSTGSGSYATIYGYASNNDKSISPINVPNIAQSDLAPDAIFYGYQGHDSIYISNHKLIRKYPIFKENDENCCPTGGSQSIKYDLVAGESSWRLEVID